MPAKFHKFGPGTISVGDVGAPVDFSCQLVNATVEWDKTKDDDVTVLCGDVVPGSTEYTSTLTGTVYQDLDDPLGIVAFSWEHMGESHPFTFVPSTSVGTEVTGTVIVDPIAVGSDEPKKNMDSEFTWDIVGVPTITIGTTPLAVEKAKAKT
jgi:hypothetical protein